MIAMLVLLVWLAVCFLIGYDIGWFLWVSLVRR